MTFEHEVGKIMLKITASREELLELRSFLERASSDRESRKFQDWHKAAELEEALFQLLSGGTP